MSQFYQGVTAGSLPPQVPTTFTADDASTATPAANNLNVFSSDTTNNNDNGIQSRASGSTVTIQLTNRGTGTTTTANDTPTTIFTFPLSATPGVYHFDGNIVAYNTTDIAGASYSFASAWRSTGAAATEISTEFKDLFEEAAMTNADFNINASGNSVVFSVTGILGKVVNWNLYFTYRFVS